MNIATMNVRICIQKSRTVTDEIGNHKSMWEDYFSCYATVSDKTADEGDTAGQTIVNERMDFTVRFCQETKAITSKEYRILLGDRIYNIISVDDMAFKHRSLKFHAELVRR